MDDYRDAEPERESVAGLREHADRFRRARHRSVPYLVFYRRYPFAPGDLSLPRTDLPQSRFADLLDREADLYREAPEQARDTARVVPESS